MSVPESRPDDTPWPSEAYGWYVVFVLCLCGMVAFVDRQIINLLVEDIKADLQLTDTQISLLQGLAFALFYAFMAVPLGRLADTGPRNRIIAIGIVVWTIRRRGLRPRALVLATVLRAHVRRRRRGDADARRLLDAGRPVPAAAPGAAAQRLHRSSFLGSGVALLVGGFVIAQPVEARGRDAAVVRRDAALGSGIRDRRLTRFRGCIAVLPHGARAAPACVGGGDLGGRGPRPAVAARGRGVLPPALSACSSPCSAASRCWRPRSSRSAPGCRPS